MSDPRSNHPPGQAGPAAEAAGDDADAADLVAKVRRLMRVTVGLTFIAVAAVFGIIGYRVYHGGGTADAPADATVILPEGAKIIQTAVSGDRIVVTLERGGGIEIRSYDLHTLKPAGRMTFTVRP